MEVGERDCERGQGRPVRQCTSVPSSSHGSFLQIRTCKRL